MSWRFFHIHFRNLDIKNWTVTYEEYEKRYSWISHDVTAAMLVSRSDPPGFERHYYAIFFLLSLQNIAVERETEEFYIFWTQKPCWKANSEVKWAQGRSQDFQRNGGRGEEDHTVSKRGYSPGCGVFAT